jgi:hypothetical protein
MGDFDHNVADRHVDLVAGRFLEHAPGGPIPDADDDADADADEETVPDPDLDRALTPEQLAAAEVLASGGTVAAAAEAAGVDRRVVDAWRTDDPVFVAELNARKQDRLDRVQGRLRGLAGTAVEAVERMIVDDSVPAAVRLRAIQIVLDAAGGLKKADEIGPCTPSDAKWAIAKRQRSSWLDSI